MTQNLKIFFGALLVLFSRIPFLDAGYGVEEDSWGIAVAAHNTRMTGVFEASRLPGHPFNEMFYVAMWGLNSWWFNFSSALMSVLLFIFSFKILEFYKVKDEWLASLAIVFVPVIYVNSTCTVDYLWSVAFIVAAFYFFLHQNWILGIIFFSISVGCRLTNVVFFLPFLFYFKDQLLGFSSSKKLTYFLFLGTMCLLWYLSVIAVYGPGFFTYSDQFPYPSWPKVLYKATLGVWGFLGCLAILAGIFFLVRTNLKVVLHHLFSHMLLLILFFFTLLYIMLPQKSAYWIQVIPFVIFFFALYLNRKQLRMVLLLFLLSPFLFGINLTDPLRGAYSSEIARKICISGQEIFFDPLGGLVQSDYSKRKRKLDYGNKVLAFLSKRTKPTAVICGWWYNQLLIMNFDKNIPSNVELKFYADETLMKQWDAKGIEIFYLPEQDIYNDLYSKISTTQQFARSIKISLRY
jgi:hypothetical protein